MSLPANLIENEIERTRKAIESNPAYTNGTPAEAREFIEGLITELVHTAEALTTDVGDDRNYGFGIS